MLLSEKLCSSRPSVSIGYRPFHLLHHLNPHSSDDSSKLWSKNPYKTVLTPSDPLQSFNSEFSNKEKAYRSTWSFDTVKTISCSSSLQASDAIAAIDFDATGTKFASGGIARKIRIYSYEEVMADEEVSIVEDGESKKRKRLMNDDAACMHVICTPAKLSSLQWKPNSSSMIVGTGDYDGMVAEWDVESSVAVVERYEHCGQKVWSIDYSSWSPFLCASSSSDGTVRMWSSNSEKSIGVITSDGINSVCSVEFSPYTPNALAIASADSNVYLYDLRNLDSPLISFHQHQRAASYVRFLSEAQLVSASIDNTVKLWDIPDSVFSPKEALANPAFGNDCLIRNFNAHTNVKNFVGLAVLRKNGLIACGSETNELFIYESATSDPLLKVKFPSKEQAYVSFVGAVCWKEHKDHVSLVAANSEGFVQVMKATTS